MLEVIRFGDGQSVIHDGREVTLRNLTDVDGGIFLRHISFHSGMIGRPAKISIMAMWTDPEAPPQEEVSDQEPPPVDVVAELNIPQDDQGNVIPSTVFFSHPTRFLSIATDCSVEISVRWDEITWTRT